MYSCWHGYNYSSAGVVINYSRSLGIDSVRTKIKSMVVFFSQKTLNQQLSVV